MKGSAIRVALIDDHEMVLQGLGALLDSHPGIVVNQKFLSGNAAIKGLDFSSVDIILSDINMPGMSGFDTLRELLNRNVDAKVMMLSMENSEKYINKAMDEGAQGYINKTASVEAVVEAIKSVFLGKTAFRELKLS